MLTDAQIQERLNYVTGSDASTILGINPYTSILELYMRKTGLKIAPDISNNPKVKAGNMLENAVADWFALETGKELITPDKMFIHKEHDFMAGNIDRMIKNENAILEVKTAGRCDGWGMQGENIIPKHYLCQVAHYMSVTDVDYAYVAVLISGWDFRHYRISRSQALERILIDKEKAFWFDNVKAEVMPQPRDMDDVISKYRNETLATPVTASLEIDNIVNKLKASKVKISELSDKVNEYKDKIALYMGANETLLNTGGEIAVTWKQSKDSIIFDAKEFQKHNTELYNRYLQKRKGSRRFLIKGEI